MERRDQFGTKTGQSERCIQPLKLQGGGAISELVAAKLTSFGKPHGASRAAFSLNRARVPLSGCHGRSRGLAKQGTARAGIGDQPLPADLY